MHRAVNTAVDDYEVKESSYFKYERAEMLAMIPDHVDKVLDVGCGAGRFGQLVKQERGAEVWGVELSPRACREAENCLDHVVNAEFGESLSLPRRAFSAVVFNDVLEHMPDPWAALEFAKQLLTETGVVVASIPSIRHFPTLWRLVVRKEWSYQEAGTLDRTHLRFFTRQTIEKLFVDTGYRIQLFSGIRPFHSLDGDTDSERLWRYFKVLNLLTLGQISDMKFLQYAVRAQPAVRV
jgi:2-polyprenyl-3-methyl-5-hydroxy-6-metoxy-1,4-benzoquinol methylase